MPDKIAKKSISATLWEIGELELKEINHAFFVRLAPCDSTNRVVIAREDGFMPTRHVNWIFDRDIVNLVQRQLFAANSAKSKCTQTHLSGS